MKKVGYILIGFIVINLFLVNGYARVQWNQDKVNEIWNIDKGLPSNSALDIIQTRDGYIWIASYEGLIRFDGKAFKVYNKSLDDRYDFNSARVIYEDSNSNLWVGTNGEGLIKISLNKVTIYNIENGLPGNLVTSIEEGENGDIFVGTTQGLAVIKKQVLYNLSKDNQNAKGYVLDLMMDSFGELYIVFNDNRIIRYSNNQYIVDCQFDNLEIDAIQSIYEDLEHNIWIGTFSGDIYFKDYEADSVIMTKSNESRYSINGFCETKDGKLWFYSDTGIGYFLKYRYDFTFMNENDYLLNNSIEGMCEDVEGNLWLASSRAGIQKFSQSKFMNYNEKNGLIDLVINSIAIKESGELFIGTDKGLAILDNNLFVENELTDYLKDIRIRQVYFDGRDNVYISTYSELGLVIYNGKTIININKDDGLTSNKVRCVFEDSKNNIWIGTRAGLNQYRYGKIIRRFTKEDGLSNDYILSIHESVNGNLYLGTNGAGIIRKDINGFSNITEERGLKGDVVFRMINDEEGNIYFTTNEGLIVKKNNRYDLITSSDGLYSTSNFEILFDDYSRAWFTSSKGVYYVAKDDIEKHMEDKNYALVSRVFNKKDGLLDGITSNAWCYSSGDNLYFATTKGLSVFDVQKIISSKVIPNVYIDKVLVDEECFSVIADNQIPSDSKRIDIYYSGTSYVNPEEVMYQYYLEGFDTEWSKSTKNRFATYTNLEKGKYTFHIKVANNDGVWSEESIVLEFYKMPHFYEKLYFKVLMYLLVIVLIIVIHGMRVRIFKKRELELKDILYETTTALTGAIDAKDEYTIGHSKRVADYSRRIGEKMNLNKESIEDLYFNALLHDIGKIGVPDAILNKNTVLTSDEYEEIKRHPLIGAKILENTEKLAFLGVGAKYHHEFYNGKGYMIGLQGEEIPLIARIISVADAYDAMIIDRKYQKAVSKKEAVEEIKRHSGTQFDPVVVEAFLAVISENFL